MLLFEKRKRRLRFQWIKVIKGESFHQIKVFSIKVLGSTSRKLYFLIEQIDHGTRCTLMQFILCNK